MLTSGTASTILGLVFVASTLAARIMVIDMRVVNVRAFVNPVIIHLSTVLLIAMLLMPTINFGSLSFLLVCIGTIGAGYEFTTAVQLWRHHRGTSAVNPIDWLWRMCLPVAGYLLSRHGNRAANGECESFFQHLSRCGHLVRSCGDS